MPGGGVNPRDDTGPNGGPLNRPRRRLCEEVVEELSEGDAEEPPVVAVEPTAAKPPLVEPDLTVETVEPDMPMEHTDLTVEPDF